jgi:hypothetical protein
VQLHRQAEFARGLEHAPRLRRTEADAFAEGIDRIHQTLRVQLAQPPAGGLHVVIGAAGIFGRHGMRAEEGGAHIHAELRADPARHRSMRASLSEVEAVAGLDLDRADAIGEQRSCARQRGCEQPVFVQRTRGAHGRNDATTLACDLFVGGALQAALGFDRAVAAEHQVGVAIDQRRRDPVTAASRTSRASVGRRPGQLRARAEPGDAPVAQARAASSTMP